MDKFIPEIRDVLSNPVLETDGQKLESAIAICDAYRKQWVKDRKRLVHLEKELAKRDRDIEYCLAKVRGVLDDLKVYG